jgi:hypothetical protein
VQVLAGELTLEVTMRQADLFFVEVADAFVGSSTESFRRGLVQQAAKGQLPDTDDLEVADVLVRLAHTELSSFGCGGTPRLDDDDMQLVLQACIAVCGRLGVDFPRLPFRNLSGFKTYWRSEGMSYSYEARRSYLERVFRPLQDELFRLSALSPNDRLLDPVSPRGGTGWPGIDRELAELRRRFAASRSDQDHCAIGAACVRVLECLGDVAFNPQRHLPAGESLPLRSKTKERFDLIITSALPGVGHENLRRFARSVIEMAHDVKHSTTPSRCEAGIAADSVICLVNMLRRITAP